MTNTKKFQRIIKNFDLIIASLALITLVFLTCAGVIMRYVIGKPFTWLEEIQLFCMVWIVFSGGGVAFRLGGHVAIEMVVEAFPLKIQKIISYLIDFVVVFVLGYFFIQSIGFVHLFIKSGRDTSILAIPYAFIYGIAPLSCIDMFISYFMNRLFPDKYSKEEI